MSLVSRATDLIGRPVVTLDEAVDIAEVKDVIFDQARSDVRGFTLRGRGMLGSPHAGLLPIGNVAAIGPDSVMIDTAEAILERDESLERSSEDARDVIHDEVLTDAGRVIGRVVDLVIDLDGSAADVVGYEIETSDGRRALVPIPATFSASGERIVVPAAVERFVTDDLTGFGAAVERFRAEIAAVPDDVAADDGAPAAEPQDHEVPR